MVYAPYILMGFISLLLQITVLRELLTVFSGNELDIGITLSVWLLSVGAGSLIASKWKARRGFSLSFMFIALLSIPTLLGIGAIRPLLGVGYGETISLSYTFISTTVVLLPLCFLIGLQFPLAVLHGNGRFNAGSVYGLEALGAFAGGALFTFVLSGRVDAAELTAEAGILSMAVFVFMEKRRSLAVLLIAPLSLFLIYRGIEPVIQSTAGEVVRRADSKYGRIVVTRLGNQLNLYWAGRLMYSYPDAQSEERRTHIPMSLHPNPVDVLAVGGSPATIREFLKYPVSRLDYVEIDPALIKTSLSLLSAEDHKILDDGRVRIIAEDGRRFINKSVKAPSYDLVVINLSEPSTAGINRFYTVEFFKEISSTLKDGGVLTLTLPSSAGYVSRRMRLANGAVYNSLNSAFGRVEVSTEEYGLFIASQSPISTEPETLKRRFIERQIKTTFFSAYVLDDAFAPLRAGLHKRRLQESGVINTDLRPTAYLYNIMLWAESHGGRALNLFLGLGGYTVVSFVSVFAVWALISLKKKARTLYYSVFTTGFAGMTLVLCVLLGYQSHYGYVYEAMGLVTALFMAGAAVGTHLMRGGIRRLLFLEILFSSFAVLIPWLFHGPALYVLGFIAGVLTGSAFKGVSLQAKDEGGRLYAFEIFGSFAGSALTAVVFVPIVGVGLTLLLAASVKGLSAIAVSFIINE